MENQNGLVQAASSEGAPSPELEEFPRYLQLLVGSGALRLEDVAGGAPNDPAAFLGRVQKHQLLAALAAQFGVPGIDLEVADVSPRISLALREDVSKTSRAVCVDVGDEGLTVAMVDPRDERAVAAVENATEFKVVERLVALTSDVAAFQELLYGAPQFSRARDVVDRLIREALALGASDIHVEPTQDEIVVRFRKDGLLIRTIDLSDAAPRKVLVHQLKWSLPLVIRNRCAAFGKAVSANEGRMSLPGREVELRVGILETVHGESVVIRIHKAREDDVDFHFSDRDLNDFLNVIGAPHGLLLVSGPAGSGRTTSMYSMLRLIDDQSKKIVTVEDSVGSVLPHVTQVEASGDAFVAALRAFQRHDPDIMMVDGIRDRETALAALDASLAGRLVLGSLHADDAARTFTRMRELGVNSLLLASTCLGTLAQRLVRRNCPYCLRKADFSPTFHGLLERYQIPYKEDDLVRGEGCPQCHHTGFHGRVGVFELMIMSPELRDAVGRDASAADIEAIARRQGMKLLIEGALTRAAEGFTTESEVLRVALSSGRADEMGMRTRAFAVSRTVSPPNGNIPLLTVAPGASDFLVLPPLTLQS